MSDVSWALWLLVAVLGIAWAIRTGRPPTRKPDVMKEIEEDFLD